MRYMTHNRGDFELEYLTGLGFMGALPAPGSTNMGPIPAGGPWPPFKGVAGTLQKACASKGGTWMGPAGKMWCQMPSHQVIAENIARPVGPTMNPGGCATGTVFDRARGKCVATKASGPSSKPSRPTVPSGGCPSGTVFSQAKGRCVLAPLSSPKPTLVGPKQTKCLASGGSWVGPKGNMYCSLPTAPTDTAALAPGRPTLVGPKQTKCLASGGSWIGPKGNMYCSLPTVPGSPVVIVPSAPVLPAPGSTVYGPIPAEWVGTVSKGPMGPKQKKCVAKGGSWIGPVGKKWCQIPPVQFMPPLPGPPHTLLPPLAPQPDETQWREEPQPQTGLRCESPYIIRNGRCEPPQACPSTHDLLQFEGGDYWFCSPKERQRQEPDGLYNELPRLPDTGRPITTDIPSGPIDYGTSPGGGAGGGAGGAMLWPTDAASQEFEAFDSGGPIAASAFAAAGLNECQADFSKYLPMPYSDGYGPMNVTQVVCPAQSREGPLSVGSQMPIEAAEMAEQGMVGMFGRSLG